MWILLHISAPVCKWCKWTDDRWQPLLHSGYRWDCLAVNINSYSNLHNDVEQKEALGHINSFSESFISIWFYILAFLVLHTIDSRIKVIWNKKWEGWKIIIWLIILKTHTHMILLIWTTTQVQIKQQKSGTYETNWWKVTATATNVSGALHTPIHNFFCFYINSWDTWALWCGIYSNHTDRSKQVFFLNAYMHTSPRFDSEVKFWPLYCTVLLQAPVWLLITIHKYPLFKCLFSRGRRNQSFKHSSLRRHVSSRLQPLIVGSSCLDDGERRLRVLSPKGQPAPEPFNEPPHVHDIEVDIVSEIGADVGVSVQQGAVERSPTYTDHHSNQAQQQQD